jgi:hypothetical protein
VCLLNIGCFMGYHEVFLKNSSHKKQIHWFNDYSTWKHLELKLTDAFAKFNYRHLGNWSMAVYCTLLFYCGIEWHNW